MTTPTPALAPPDRIGVLDLLRGIALLGMFLVHFSDFATGGTSADLAYQHIVELFFSGRFSTMFGILFGAGFAIQFQRAEARGQSFVRLYFRRTVGLAIFGAIAHGVFGFNVLLAYAIWGAVLIAFRRWSVPALLLALALSAASMNVYPIGRVGYGIATRGEEAVRSRMQEGREAVIRFNRANREQRQSTDYATVFGARIEHMKWFYAQPFSFLPANNLTLLLLGLLGMRLGLFDRPEKHRRLIVGLMIFGVASWAAANWLFPSQPPPGTSPMLPVLIRNRLASGFGLIRDGWLAFAYIGAVLLLVARNPAWLSRLAVFGWTGRMALTNYMVQIAILDLTFSPYGLGLSITPLVGLLAALGLFVADAVLSRWWLTRFRYGPLEWVWRSMTYGSWQPWRVAAGSA